MPIPHDHAADSASDRVHREQIAGTAAGPVGASTFIGVKMRLEWFIAQRYLASGKVNSFLSLITLISIGGIAVGVMALIVVTGVMSGLQQELRDKIVGANAHIWVMPYGAPIVTEDWEELARRVRAVDGVLAAAPFINSEVALRNSGGYAEAGILRGIHPQAEGEAISEVVRRIRAGEFSLEPTASGLPPLLLGEGLAQRLGVGRGDYISALSLQGVQVSQMGTLMPTFRKFEVAGTFRMGMYEYDNKFMYTSIEAAQDLSALGSAVTGIEVRISDPMESTSVAAAITEEIDNLSYYVQDWKTRDAALFSALLLEKMAMSFILLLIVIVAGFNIVSTLVMLVKEKGREIGILRSMGLKASQVLRVFLIQGIVIGAVGSTIGAATGLMLCWAIDRFHLIRIPPDVYFIEYLPVAFDVQETMLIVLAGLVISFVATIYPARQAARMVPVEAIRE